MNATPSSFLGFVLLVGFLVLVTITAIIVIIVRAPSTADQLTLIGAIVAFMAPLITAVLALFRAEKANGIATTAQVMVANHAAETNAPPVTPPAVSDAPKPPAPGV